MSHVPPHDTGSPAPALADSPALLLIADDLSGAADSAVALATSADTVVALHADAEWPRATVVAVDTDSRYASTEDAAERAAACVRRSAAGTRIYKKVDSTLRGNIGPEVRGCLAALGEREGRRHIAVVSPAFPATGRTVVDGRVRVGGESVEARHPARKPLVAQLEAAGLTVALLSVAELRDGDPARALAAAAAAAAGTADAVVVDALTDDDLARTVRATAGLPVLLVGSGGMAHHLGSLRTDAAAAPGATAPADAQGPPLTGPALICVGSRSTQALAQGRTLIEELPALPVEVGTAAGGTASAMRELRTALAAGHNTVVSLDPHRPVEPERAHEFAVALAEVTRAGLDSAGVLIATGGETARTVLLAAGVNTLAVEGEVEPGVVLMRTPGGLPVVTKAGAFGDPGTLLRATRALQGPAAPGRGRTAPARGPAASAQGPAASAQGPRAQIVPARPVLPMQDQTPKDDTMSAMSKPIIAITMGDAAGVGPEVVVKALAGAAASLPMLPLVVGDAKRLGRAIELTGAGLRVNAVASPEEATYQPGTVDCLDLANIPEDLPFGRLSPVAGEGAYQYIEAATRLASERRVDAICTAPLNKEALHAAGHNFPGHTELLAELTGTEEVSMLLSAPKLRVIHVTTHIGLVDAVAKIEPGLVERTVRRGYDTLVAAGIPEPRIAVCGINPHAGENGLFGHGEEESKIVPAIEKARAEGIDAQGPLPADTVFFRAVRGDFDLVVAMYHDQGHGPVKVLGLDAGVNITVGLPVIRTSVDHGTAFDIAGTGRADEASMVEALRQAVDLAPRRGGEGSGQAA
ncbi:4-hydroxythreonine-4-phosphate dehydrogenase PdxA [Streptomyces montanisoli]|uniref:4-hydroxythreonine-4-phosphate dehydrogenase PdxA n=1 Tax=Streptomyces montanisoli TaxID=2798581 RepID=A0A940RV59_9ACTN|nr:4-hydroxythreonine-4-phosphate dehydrogenase PdxA [Streptomyces montanisoli]MBP0457926.1 4-hydroxythreonine-4-phosphate dehydrogenase PdxA [Streptomyces montanisoli]